MAAPGSTAAAPARLIAFARSPQGRPALLGLCGAALITLGGAGAGSTRLHDPVLEMLHLSWLRFGHGLVVSSLLLWGGVAAMLLAWLWLGRRLVDGTGVSERTMVVTTGFWLVPLLVSVPLFSRDTYSYLAQGALLRDGFDPYARDFGDCDSVLTSSHYIWIVFTVAILAFVVVMAGWFIREGLIFRFDFMNKRLVCYENAPEPTVGTRMTRVIRATRSQKTPANRVGDGH